MESNIPKRFKRNTIKAELYRAKRISSNFTNEVTLISNKCKPLNYPIRFVNSVINEFIPAQTNKDIQFTIPPWLIAVKEKLVLVEILYLLLEE